MTANFYFLKTITTLAFLGLANLACAEVVRCEGTAGDVSYTDTVCGEDVQTSHAILVEKPPVKNVTYQQPAKPISGRASNWANISIAPSKPKVDTESVRSARIEMISMDRNPRYAHARK